MTILAQANRLIKIAAPKVAREEDKRPEFRPATPLDAWAYFGMRPAPHQLENVERKTRFSVDVWHRRAGKALALDTPVPMADGSWSTMGALKAGDVILGRDGEPTVVLEAWPVMYGRPCYRVTFDCGQEIVADEDHLWATTTKADRHYHIRPEGTHGRRVLTPRPASVRTTKEIAATLRSRGEWNHRVPAVEAVQHPPADLVLDPYLLGLWLGDGTTRNGQFTGMDGLEQAFVRAGFEVVPTKHQNGGKATTFNIRGLARVLGTGKTTGKPGLHVLGDKHIPEAYLRASREQRISLLQGLMDTDGYIDADGKCELVMKRGRLAEDVSRLLWSLGLIHMVQPKPGVDCVRIHFTPHFQVFRLPRKAERWRGRAEHNRCRSIVAVEPVPSVPVRCITVDAADSLFLVGEHYIPTHNTIAKIMKLLDRAVNCPFPNGRYAYLGPTYSQVEDIAWAELRDRALEIPGATVKDSRLAVYIPTVRGSVSRIRLYGVDSPKQRLRGGYLDGVVTDEWQHIPEHVWTQQVRPMLSDKSRQGFDHRGYPNQWADFIGTPLGRNHLYRMYDRAARWQAGEAVTWRRHDGSVVTNTSTNWSASLYTVHQTGMVTLEEIANLRADLSPTEFAQEYECDFEAGVEGAIYRLELEELRASGRITDVRYNPNLQVNTCWDLGWNDMTVVWFFQRVAGTPIFIGYLQFIGASIPTIVQRVREYAVTDGQAWRLGVNYMPHDVAQHELGSGKSRISQFSEAGLIGTPVRKAPKIEQITATRRLLKHAVFSRACMDGLDLLATYRRERDEKTGVLKEEPVHDMASHVADALATGAIGMPKWSFGSRYNSQTTAET